jgi:hypothetical protein
MVGNKTVPQESKFIPLTHIESIVLVAEVGLFNS